MRDGGISVVAPINLKASTNPPPCCATDAFVPSMVTLPLFASTGTAVVASIFFIVKGDVAPWTLKYNATTPEI